MTEKELREIKRRLRPERNNISKIVGCFVNGNNEIVSKINQSIGMGESVVTERLLSVMKKSLSGSLGTNLTDISFSTKDVLEKDEHKLLSQLVKTKLADEDVLDTFYKKAIQSLKFEGNYVILLTYDVYDVPTYNKDGDAGESTETFSYIIAAICPVKSMPEALSFKESDSLFHTFSASAVLSSPELGFMFPTFDERKTNIYNALYYTRSLSESYGDFTKSIFASEPPMPPKLQKATFNDCLADALAEECDFSVVRAIHSEIDDMITTHKDSRDPEPLKITKETVKSILSDNGVGEEKLEKLSDAFDECFGKNAELTPKNIISTNKFEVEMPEVSVKVSPEHRNLVSTEIINGVKYVIIKVTGPVSVNGVNITVED